MCVSVWNTVDRRLKINNSRKFKFDIMYLYHTKMLLEIFTEISETICVQGHGYTKDTSAIWYE